MVVNNIEDEKKLNSLMKITRNSRQNWIQTKSPTLTEILNTYTKFNQFDYLVC